MKTMLQITECTRKNLCVDCDDARCMHKGRLMADCPKYMCDRKGELFEDCESCDFLKWFQAEERARYEECSNS